MTIPLWPDPKPRRRKRWTPRCDDCGRRIWSARALIRWRGLLLGGQCYRKRKRALERLAIPVRITVNPPGDIPGQTDLLEITE